MAKTSTKLQKASKQRSMKMVVPMHKLFEKHDGHARHLCELAARRQMAQVARASKGANYLCHICGRAASKPTSLCEPVAI